MVLFGISIEIFSNTLPEHTLVWFLLNTIQLAPTVLLPHCQTSRTKDIINSSLQVSVQCPCPCPYSTKGFRDRHLNEPFSNWPVTPHTWKPNKQTFTSQSTSLWLPVWLLSRSIYCWSSFLTKSWSSSFRYLGETFAVALDISKAFDRVWYKALTSYSFFYPSLQFHLKFPL